MLGNGNPESTEGDVGVVGGLTRKVPLIRDGMRHMRPEYETGLGRCRSNLVD